MPCDRAGRIFAAKLGVILHNIAHQLLDHLLTDGAILRARQFGHRLGDRGKHFIGVDGIGLAAGCRIFGEKVVDELDHHAMQARPLFCLVLGHGFPFRDKCK